VLQSDFLNVSGPHHGYSSALVDPQVFGTQSYLGGFAVVLDEFCLYHVSYPDSLKFGEKDLVEPEVYQKNLVGELSG
jgi:hypothetical protein